MIKVTRIILWIVVLSFLAYFIFLPIEVKREKPTKISPIEITTSSISSEELPALPKY